MRHSCDGYATTMRRVCDGYATLCDKQAGNEGAKWLLAAGSRLLAASEAKANRQINKSPDRQMAGASLHGNKSPNQQIARSTNGPECPMLKYPEASVPVGSNRQMSGCRSRYTVNGLKMDGQNILHSSFFILHFQCKSLNQQITISTNGTQNSNFRQ